MPKTFQLKESLSIVIPAFKEEGNLPKLIPETVKEAKKVCQDFEIIIVNDGSPDKTGEVAEQLAKKYKEVRVIHHKKNQGLAAAWKTGIEASKKDLILYIEGDGQQPFKDQYDLLEKLKDHDLTVGVRTQRFDYTFFRKSLSVGFVFLIWLLFGVRFRDALWCQAYRRRIFEKVKIKSISPFFAAEVIIKAKQLGYSVIEARSYYRSRETGSTSLGNIKTAYRIFKEMLMLRLGQL